MYHGVEESSEIGAYIDANNRSCRCNFLHWVATFFGKVEDEDEEEEEKEEEEEVEEEEEEKKEEEEVEEEGN